VTVLTVGCTSRRSPERLSLGHATNYTAVVRGQEAARAARRLGIVEISDLIAGIEQRAEPLELLVALPAARQALARLERAEQEDTDGR
jgi:hypothetical protein